MAVDRASGRRTVGIVLAGSASLLGIVAALVLLGTIPVAEQSRTLVAGALGFAAALDVLLGLYFFFSDRS